MSVEHRKLWRESGLLQEQLSNGGMSMITHDGGRVRDASIGLLALLMLGCADDPAATNEGPSELDAARDVSPATSADAGLGTSNQAPVCSGSGSEVLFALSANGDDPEFATNFTRYLIVRADCSFYSNFTRRLVLGTMSASQLEDFGTLTHWAERGAWTSEYPAKCVPGDVFKVHATESTGACACDCAGALKGWWYSVDATGTAVSDEARDFLLQTPAHNRPVGSLSEHVPPDATLVDWPMSMTLLEAVAVAPGTPILVSGTDDIAMIRQMRNSALDQVIYTRHQNDEPLAVYIEDIPPWGIDRGLNQAVFDKVKVADQENGR